jgi:DNA polymerase-3 subunit delta
MDSVKFLETAKTGKLKNLYLFYGEEQYLMLKTINYLKSVLLSPGTMEVNATTLEGKAVTHTDIVQTCESFPMFGSNRLVIVRDFPFNSSSDWNELDSYLKRLPVYTYLILTALNPDKRRKLYKTIKEIGEIVEFKPLDSRHMLQRAKSIFNKAGKEIEPHALNTLVQTANGDLSMLENEAEKLINFTGDKAKITVTDMSAICSFTAYEKIFGLLDAIGTRNAKDAIVILNRMLNQGEQPIVIFAMIGRQLKTLLHCKILSEAGFSVSELNSKIKAHPYVIKKSLNQSRNFTITELEYALNRCRELDAKVKTGGVEPRLALELFTNEFE